MVLTTPVVLIRDSKQPPCCVQLITAVLLSHDVFFFRGISFIPRKVAVFLPNHLLDACFGFGDEYILKRAQAPRHRPVFKSEEIKDVGNNVPRRRLIPASWTEQEPSFLCSSKLSVHEQTGRIWSNSSGRGGGYGFVTSLRFSSLDVGEC